MQTFIRFEGFYCSTLDQLFDDQAGQELEMRNDNDDGAIYDIDIVAISDAAAEYRTQAGEIIFDLLSVELTRAGCNIGFEFAGIDSPREYNFSTDRLKVNYDGDALGAFWQLCRHSKPKIVAGFVDWIGEQLKPRSGFMPFYSDDLRKWGAFSDWDHMQHALLIEYLTRAANSFFNPDFWDYRADYWDLDGLNYAGVDELRQALEYQASLLLPEPVLVEAPAVNA